MKSFFSHRSTRRTAAVMLFVWLLALATGVANACLVQPEHARHGHAVHVEVQMGTVEARAAAGQAANHAHQTSPASQACQSFCAAEQTGVTKSAGELLPPLAVLAPMPGPAAWAAASPAAMAGQRNGRAAPALVRPPVAIRFLRLTI